MELTCIRCNATHDNAVAIGYCPSCRKHFADVRAGIHARQRPSPGVIADGKFAATKECPQTVLNELDQTVCGLCGSDEIEAGYGLGSGFGVGSYNFCFGCNTFLDFHEDAE